MLGPTSPGKLLLDRANHASTHKLLIGICSACFAEYMNNQPPKQVFGPAVNRISDVMVHTNRYAFRGVSRLASDARVSASSISRLINGKINPSFLLVSRVATALGKQLGQPVDPRDLVAECGEFLTRFTCDLVGCRGCLPENAMDEFGDIKPAFAGVQPGRWVTSRHPKGFQHKKGDK